MWFETFQVGHPEIVDGTRRRCSYIKSIDAEGESALGGLIRTVLE